MNSSLSEIDNSRSGGPQQPIGAPAESTVTHHRSPLQPLAARTDHPAATLITPSRPRRPSRHASSAICTHGSRRNDTESRAPSSTCEEEQESETKERLWRKRQELQMRRKEERECQFYQSEVQMVEGLQEARKLMKNMNRMGHKIQDIVEVVRY